MTTATTPVVSHLSQYFIFVVPRALSFSNKRDVCDVLCWYVRRDTSGGAPPAPIPTCIQMLLLLLLFLLLKSIKTTKDITVGIQNKNKLIFSFVFRKCSLQCGSFWYTLSCFVYFSPYYLFVLLLKQKQNTRVSFFLLLVEGVGAVHINYTQPTICLSVVNVWWVLLSLCCVRELRELTEKTIIYSLAASQASYFFECLHGGMYVCISYRLIIYISSFPPSWVVHAEILDMHTHPHIHGNTNIWVAVMWPLHW